MDHNPFGGRLSYSVGETLLSAWEAACLAPGDIVLTSREAGYPGLLLLNNLPLALGEVVVLDGVLGVRVVDSDFRPAFQVDPGRIDTVGELLPAIVEIGSFVTDWPSLRGLATHSFINLGARADAASDGVLLYAGAPLARGKVVVVGELMGLRILERLADLPVPEFVRQSGNLADRSLAARAKDYNFSMPDKWSHDQIRRLGEIHRLFQRNLEASLPPASGLLEGRTDGLFVDQCTLGEARATLAGWGLNEVFTWDHNSRRGRREGGGPASRTLLLEAADCPQPLSAATRRFLAEISVGTGPLAQQPVFLHRGPALAEADPSLVTGCLRGGWKKYLDFGLEPLDEGSVGTLAEYEMVILIVLRRDAQSVPALALVYPFLTLEPYMNLLGS